MALQLGLAVLAGVGLWLALLLLIGLVYRRDIARLAAEPAWRHPVLVIESDDWGAGPLAQGEALHAIAEVLGRHRDASGHAGCMSLALVLAVPQGPALRDGGGYRRVALDEPTFAPVLGALRAGVQRGVFALQLHGHEHFWPEALLASNDPAVRAWLQGPVPARTEALPSHLQSRWVDASTLPSRPLAPQAVLEAAAAECAAFARITGAPARVVVPPTFVWTADTERAWQAQGVACIVTPGWRSTLRDSAGLPAGDEGPFYGGQRAQGLVYLVRSDYFEPARGRGAAHALAALDRAQAEGRPCILENHRDNFIGTPAQRDDSLQQLQQLLHGATSRWPGLRFLSSWEVASVLRERDARWLLTGLRERAPFFWARLSHSGRLWKLLRLTGAALLAGAAVSAVRRRR